MTKVEVKKDKNNSQYACANNTLLFQFEWRTKKLGGPGWYFWLRGDYDPDIFMQKDFPKDFFKKAVESKTFIAMGKDFDGIENFDDVVDNITK